MQRAADAIQPPVERVQQLKSAQVEFKPAAKLAPGRQLRIALLAKLGQCQDGETQENLPLPWSASCYDKADMMPVC
jgi:hypothetical protein